MNFGKCPTCGEYGFLPHKCDPQWYAFRYDEEIYERVKFFEEPYKCFASEPEKAAIKFCEHDWEMPSELTVFIISMEDYNKIIFELDEEKGNYDEIANKVHAKCLKFCMQSELIRQYYACRA